MNQAHALPRIHIKRRKPPSGWRVFWLIQMSVALSQIAHVVVQIERFGIASWYTIFAAFILVVWTALYLSWRAMYKLHTTLEERGLPMRPPNRSTWIMLGFVVVFVGIFPWFA